MLRRATKKREKPMRITTDGTFSHDEQNRNYYRQFGAMNSNEVGGRHVASLDIVFQRCTSDTPLGIVEVNGEPLFCFNT